MRPEMRTGRPARALTMAVFLLLGPLAAPARGQESGIAPEPWIIEGEALDGSRQGGTDLTAPVILHGGLRAVAERGRLSPDRDVATLYGSVEISDTARTITAREGLYRRSSRLLDLVGDVRGRGPEGILECNDLTWDRLAGHLVLRGDPRVSEPTRILWADRIEYDTNRREGLALGQVRVLMMPDSTWAYGERSEYAMDSGRSLLTGEPRLESPGVEGEPRLIVLADTLLIDESTRAGEARGHVRIERGLLRARSDRALFRLAEARIILSGHPVTWAADGEIRADSMTVRLRRREADQLRAWGNVRVRYEPRDKPGERNLVMGDTLVAALNGGAVRDLEVRGSAVSLYLPALGDARQGSGRNLAQASLIRVQVERGEANLVDLIGNATGSYRYPSDSAQRGLREPALLDSIVPAWMQETFSAGGGDTPPAEPPALPPPLAAMLERRLLVPPDSLASPLDRYFDEQVDYQGDTIRFYVPEDRIRILGRGVLEYRQSKLEAARVDYEADRRLVTALGQPRLSDQSSTVTGTKMTYRTDEREGIVYLGRTEFDGGRYLGREVKKLSGDELLVRGGDYTTCEADSAPHFHFHAPRMKLILKDKAVARPVILYLRRIPVLALPFYIFPLQKGRRSGVMMPDLELGISRSAGRFVRNFGYYWAISDYMDARSWIDYYDDGPRIYYNGIYRYRIRYLLDGDFQGSWLRDSNRDSGGESRGWSVRGTHAQTLPGGATLGVRADFTSSRTFRGDQDFGAGIDDRLNRRLKSSVELRRSWSRVSSNLALSRLEYLDETTGAGVKVQYDGPSADFTINTGALGRAPDASGRGGRLPGLSTVYFGTGFRFRSVSTRRFDRTSESNQAIQETFSLSDNRKLGPYLRISPSLSASWAAFAEDARGRRNRGGASWSGSVSTGSTLYGNLLVRPGPLTGLRHVVEPSASWSYAPELRSLTYHDTTTGTRRSQFPSVGGIGLSGSKRSALSLSLNQRFHAKWGRGEKTVKKENLITWNTGTSYDFLAKRVTGTARTRHFSTVSTSIGFRPFSSLESSASASYDPYDWDRLSLSVQTTARIQPSLFGGGAPDSARAPGLEYGNFGEAGLRGSGLGGRTGTAVGAGTSTAASWNLSVSHSFARRKGSKIATNSLNLGLGLGLTPKWRGSGSIYVDLRERDVVSHSFTLQRDLHCWDLRFEHRTSGDRAEYFFRINVKDLPDVQYHRESR